MPVSDEVIARARKLSRPAVEAVLADAYPAVVRMARALTGREGAARQIVAAVLKRSVRVLPSWRAGAPPSNWFYHHTVLAARSAAGPPPAPTEDLLVCVTADAGPQYAAFIAAIRKLPLQQREAFILHHGERLNERFLGVAMDCSSNAAAAHLHAATQAAEAFTGGNLPALAQQLTRAYAHLGPTEDAVLPSVRRRVRAAMWGVRLRKIIRLLILITFFAAVAWAAWHWHDQLVQWFSSLRK